MRTMRIKRPRPANRRPMFACGCLGVLAGGLVMLVVVGLLLILALPSLALRFAGFSPKGDTQAVFSSAPQPTPVVVQNAVQPPQAVIDLGQYGQQAINTNSDLYQIAVGQASDTGAQAAVVTFSEASLMAMCQQRSDICKTSTDQYRNARIDLRPGGAVIYADVTVPNIGVSQTMGVVLRLDGSRRQFQVAGLDVGGTLFDLPSGQLGDTIRQIAQQANDLLSQLSLEASGGRYSLSEVQIDDNTLTLILR
jgi:hypothetical protein